MSPLTPFATPRTIPNPWDHLQNDLNRYAGRGFPVVTPLRDCYEGGHGLYGVVGSQLWGTNDSSIVANAFGANTTTRAVAINTLAAVPFLWDNNWPLTRILFRVTTGAAGSAAVTGIYDCKNDLAGDIYPNRLLYNSSAFTTTANNTSHEASPNLPLLPGRLYWAVYHVGTLAPTITTITSDSVGPLIGASMGAGGIAVSTHISVARTYSATLPSYFTSGAVVATTTPPAIGLGYGVTGGGSVLSRTFPGWGAGEAGWVVRGARLLVGSTKQTGTNPSSLVVKARIRTSQGPVDLGDGFDSRTAKATEGVPFSLTGDAPLDARMDADSRVEVYIEQRGWPLLTAADCAVAWVLARTGA